MASDLPVELLEAIFLHLDDTADLARASAACAPFRRAVSDHRFLRRFRSHHRGRLRPPPVLGFLENRGAGKIGFHPVHSPRRSALAAAAFAQAADFTFSFIVPGTTNNPNSRLRVSDARDGRVLLSRYKRVWHALHRRPPLLVVCDPLHRRHVEIPPIPGHLLDLAAAAAGYGDSQELKFDVEPFLAPATAADNDGGGEADELSSFQVICNVLSVTNKLLAFAFSSSSGQWRAAAYFWDPNHVLRNLSSQWVRQSVRGCFYWTRFSEDFVLVLDTTRSEMRFFVISDIPHKSHGRSKIVVEAAGEDRLGLLLLLEDRLELYSRAWHGNNGDYGGFVVPDEHGEEWRHDKTVPLFAGLWNLSGAAEGYAFLRWLPRNHADLCNWKPHAHYFTVDLKTLLVERSCGLEFCIIPKFLFASFPPPFSLPTV